MGRRVSKWIDDLQLLDDRAGPPVRDDERQRIFLIRANLNEMNVKPIDLGHKIRQGVHFRFGLAPIVVRGPIPSELLDRRELHALRRIRYRFSLRPLCRVYAPPQIHDRFFGNVDMEGTDCVTRGGEGRVYGKQAGGAGCGDPHCCGLQELSPLLADDLRRHVHLPGFIELR